MKGDLMSKPTQWASGHSTSKLCELLVESFEHQQQKEQRRAS